MFPIYLFFELKSKDEPFQRELKFEIDDIIKLPKHGRQYNHIKKTLKDINMKYLYIYVTTDEVESMLNAADLCVMGRNDTFRLLAPIADLYTVARSINKKSKSI